MEHGKKAMCMAWYIFWIGGPDKGLFAIVLDPQAAAVEGYFFSSEKLTEHWDALDEFEGIQYQRVRVQGVLESGERVDAWTYEMKPKQR